MSELSLPCRKILLLCSPCSNEESGIPNRIHELKQTIESLGIECCVYLATTSENVSNRLEEETPDLIWSSVYYLKDQSGLTINCHQFLEEKRIPYVGSSPEVLDLVLTKSDLKKRWISSGVRTPAWQVVQSITELDSLAEWHHFPAIIKPNEEGNSRGLSQESIVDSATSAIQYLEKELSHFSSELVEHYLGYDSTLQEFTIAMVGNIPDRFLMPAEIILENIEGKRVITTSDKDLHRTRAIPVSDPELKARVIDFATQAVNAAGVEDYARLDVIWSEGDLHALEINGQPMLPDRWFDTCCEAGGMDRTAYVKHILNAAVQKWQYRSQQDTFKIFQT